MALMPRGIRVSGPMPLSGADITVAMNNAPIGSISIRNICDRTVLCVSPATQCEQRHWGT
jgi:hypothetical protein